jgi:hypothetical protein
MRDIFTLFLHAIVTIVRLAQPGGLRSVVAESVLMRHQVLESESEAGSQPSVFRSHDRRFLHSLDAAGQCCELGDRLKDLEGARKGESS